MAGITITILVGENGIITKTQQAAEATKNGQDKEMQGLANLEEWISDATGEYAWKVSSDGTKVVNKNYPEGIEIGSYINYDCTPVDGSSGTYTSYSVENASNDKNNGRSSGYNSDQTFSAEAYKNTGYSWRVLGVDSKGQLTLMSEETVPITIASREANTFNEIWGHGGTRNCYFIKGKAGYKTGTTELNAICNIYGHGAGATGGKLITIEEINHMTGLNGNNEDGNGKKCGVGEVYEYENKVTYYWDGTDKPYYETSNGLKGNLSRSHNNGFHWYDESAKEWKKSEKSTTATRENKEKIAILTNTFYGYSIIGTAMEINDTKIYKTLFTNSSTGAHITDTDEVSGVAYYINSSAVYTDANDGNWGTGNVSEGTVLSGFLCEKSNGEEGLSIFGVRPTVSLKSNIKLTKRSDQRDNCDFYDIVVE